MNTLLVPGEYPVNLTAGPYSTGFITNFGYAYYFGTDFTPTKININNVTHLTLMLEAVIIVSGSKNVFYVGYNGGSISMRLINEFQTGEMVIDLQGGMDHTLLKTTRGFYVFGDNTFGNLCTGDYDSANSSFILSKPLTDMHAIILTFSVGHYHNIFTTRENQVFGCGSNLYGELALLNTTKTVAIPKLLFELKQNEEILRADAGGEASLFIVKTHLRYPNYIVIIPTALVALFGVILAIMLVGIVAYFSIKKVRKNQKKKLQYNPLSQQEGSRGSFELKYQFKNIPMIHYDELNDFYEIGSGGSGAVVYNAKWKSIDVAVKMFQITENSSEEHCANIENELQLMQTLHHANIICFYGACMKVPRFAIVMEYCESGSLSRYIIKNKGNISWEQKLVLLNQICSGMAFLHMKQVIHRDLKCKLLNKLVHYFCTLFYS